MVVTGCLLAEKGLMWQAIHSDALRMGDGGGLRDVDSKGSWKCVSVETEVDFWVEVKAGVRPSVKSQAPHCSMSGEITVDKDWGADNLRREIVENGTGKENNVGRAALGVSGVEPRAAFAFALVSSLSFFFLVPPCNGTALESDWVMSASCKSQVKGHPFPDHQVVLPNAASLAGPNTGDEE